MPRVFVYEYLTAVGLGHDPADPLHGMYREGRAMRDAIAADFAAVPGWEVWTIPDEAIGQYDNWLDHGMEAAVDKFVVIAPETEGVLEAKIRTLSPDQHLGCSPAAVRLTADKLGLAEFWRGRGVPTPVTREFDAHLSLPFPQVWKPRDGCGSTATIRVDSPADADAARETLRREEFFGELIAQPFVPGRPASVAFLVGPAQIVPLLPTFQRLAGDGRFGYAGGELPIRPDLAGRAVALGRRAIDGIPGLLGYVGVDLILGDAADGSEDYAIEINPRLTTSYVGLRELADFNLAGAMLALAGGETVTPEWKPGAVRFFPDGRTERLSGVGEFFE